MSFAPISACRSCSSRELAGVLDLGTQPLANAYRSPNDNTTEARFPLALVRCQSCSLVQLTGTVPPNLMFDSYHYFSSYSTTMVESMGNLAARIVSERTLGSDDLVVEIASNDGYLLRHYVALGIPVLGVEPAANVAAVALAAGVPTRTQYFSAALAATLVNENARASVVHANNVMAHVPDINDFVAGIALLLHEDGVVVIETPYLVKFIEDREFDTVYHEHVFYYSLTALSALMQRHGLVVGDVEQIEMHGGSIRVFVQHEGAEVSPRVQALLADENDRGVTSDAYYADFADRVAALKLEVTKLVRNLLEQGASVAAYGAAAKGTVLLNHFGLDASQIDFVADRSVHKQGLLMPGVSIPVVAADELAARRPDYTLLLAWNFAQEIIGQQQAYKDLGGQFIVPVPSIAIR